MNRVAKLIAVCVATAVSIGALVGCAPRPTSLEGTSWTLIGWSVSSIDPADFRITARFDGGQITGNSGVNSYGGPYEQGPGNAFSAGELVSTLMAGPEPAMRAETAYMKLLAEARSFEVSADTLTLFDAKGNEALIFEVAGK